MASWATRTQHTGTLQPLAPRRHSTLWRGPREDPPSTGVPAVVCLAVLGALGRTQQAGWVTFDFDSDLAADALEPAGPLLRLSLLLLRPSMLCLQQLLVSLPEVGQFSLCRAGSLDTLALLLRSGKQPT